MAARKSASSRKHSPAPVPSAAAVADRTIVEHGAYQIIAGRRQGECAAVGYLGNKRIATATGDSVDAAVSAVSQALDVRVSGLRAERLDGVPTEAEYREALGGLYRGLPSRMKAMLETHCRMPGAATALSDLARRFGVSENTVKLGYGKLARGLSGVLDFAPVDDSIERRLLPLLCLGTIAASASGDRQLLHLSPELVGALRAVQQIPA